MDCVSPEFKAVARKTRPKTDSEPTHLVGKRKLPPSVRQEQHPWLMPGLRRKPCMATQE